MRSRLLLTVIAAAQIVIAGFGVSALLAPRTATAVTQTVPYKINFQGRLTDNSGNILTDGSYNVKFRLFDASSGGTNQWEEDRVYGSPDRRITVTSGLFNIQFGDVTALTPALFNRAVKGDLWLEVELPTPATASGTSPNWTELPMTPRQPLASAPYALNADTIDGLDSAQIVQLSPAAQQTGSINIDGGITLGSTLQTTGTIFTNGSNSNTVTLQAGVTSGNYTLTLPLAQAVGTKILQNDGSGNLSWVPAGGCNDCVLNDSGATDATQTIAPTTDVTSLTIRQTSAGSPTKNVFAVTNSAGTTSYIKVDQAGVLSLASTAGTTIDLNNAAATTLTVTNSNGSAVANLSVEGGVSIGSGQTYKVNGTQISSADLSNNSDLAKLTANTTQSFTGQNTFSRNGTGTGDYSVGVTGAPVADSTSELLRLGGQNISGGSSSGTFIGANPASFSGDFENFQVNGVTVLKHTAQGDQTTGFTQLDGSSTTNGTGNSKTSMVLNSVTNFDAGNYIRLQNGTACDGTATTCYAKIISVTPATNTLVISPALTWATGKTVDEWHVPEVGGTDLAQTLTNRYGRGYFIAGVATGNGTTYYNEDGISSTLTTFNLLSGTDSSVTDLELGKTGTTVNVPGALTVNSQSVVNSSGQINGAQLQANSVANSALANSSVTLSGTGLTVGGASSNSVALGSSLALAITYGSSANTAVQGNVTLTCPSGSGNLTGGGTSITLGSGGSCAALDTISNPNFSGLVTASKSGANALAVTGTPLAGASGATSSLVQFGTTAIASGNSTATTGGTWLGLNAASSGAGSTADFINFQNNGIYKFKVTGAGLLDAVGGVAVNGTSVISSSGVVAGASQTYGSTTNTAVQGNTSLTCPSGTGNLSGTGNTITLGSGGTCNSLSTVNNPTFSTSVTSPSFTGTGAVTLSSGGLSDLTLDSASNVIQVASNDTTLQHAADYTIDLNGAADTTLTLQNSTSGKVANLSVDGSATVNANLNVNLGAANAVTINSATAPTTSQTVIDNSSSTGVTTGDSGTGFSATSASGLRVKYKGGAAAVESEGVRVDYAPGTTTGGTWSGLRIVAGATGSATGVSSYGLKLEGPTTPGTGNDEGAYIGSGWDIGIDVQSGGIQLAAMSDPSTPAAGNVRVYSKTIAGRTLPKWKAPSGVDTPFQSSFGFNRIAMMAPAGNGTTATTIMTAWGTAFTNNGSVFSDPALASTNLSTSVRRARLQTATNSGTAIAYHIPSALMAWRGNAAGLGGFFYTIRFNLATTNTNNRAFVGLVDSTAAPTSVDPLAAATTTPGRLGMAINLSTGNWSWENTASGTAPTVTGLGASFPVNTTDLYELIIFSPPNGSSITYRVQDISTGAVTADTAVSTNIPSNTTFLAPEYWIADGGTTGAAAIDSAGWYLESDN